MARSTHKLPSYHKIKIIDATGAFLEIMSTYGKPGQELVLDTAISQHPAWAKDKSGQLLNTRVDQVIKYQSKAEKSALTGSLQAMFATATATAAADEAKDPLRKKKK